MWNSEYFSCLQKPKNFTVSLQKMLYFWCTDLNRPPC